MLTGRCISTCGTKPALTGECISTQGASQCSQGDAFQPVVSNRHSQGNAFQLWGPASAHREMHFNLWYQTGTQRGMHFNCGGQPVLTGRCTSTCGTKPALTGECISTVGAGLLAMRSSQAAANSGYSDTLEHTDHCQHALPGIFAVEQLLDQRLQTRCRNGLALQARLTGGHLPRLHAEQRPAGTTASEYTPRIAAVQGRWPACGHHGAYVGQVQPCGKMLAVCLHHDDTCFVVSIKFAISQAWRAEQIQVKGIALGYPFQTQKQNRAL